MAGGIPEDRIFLDYAGFRTLDSMIRANIVFGLDSVTVISQEFHNETRAFYRFKERPLRYRFQRKRHRWNPRDESASQGVFCTGKGFP